MMKIQVLGLQVHFLEFTHLTYLPQALTSFQGSLQLLKFCGAIKRFISVYDTEFFGGINCSDFSNEL